MDYVKTEKPSLSKSAFREERRIASEPKIYLWVWRYDADMTWIDNTRYGIAYLAGTVKIGPRGIVKKPRLNSLKVPDNTSVEAVVRIESAPGVIAHKDQVKTVRNLLISQIPLKKVEAVQIDFDATRSERPFYKELLVQLKESLPEKMPLYMTALASWTLFDRWSGDLPGDTVVPMFFHMGKDRNRVISCLEKGMVKDARATLAIGIVVDEPDVYKSLSKMNGLKQFDKVYLFSPGGWRKESSKSFARIVEKQFSK